MPINTNIVSGQMSYECICWRHRFSDGFMSYYKHFLLANLTNKGYKQPLSLSTTLQVNAKNSV